MNLLLLCLVGLMCGLHAATWGGFKDSPFEGFKPASFVRSILLGLGSALAISLATDLESTQSVLVLVGLCYVLERLATEWWKAIVREDDQSAYSIPMRLAVHGRPIDEQGRRYADRRDHRGWPAAGLLGGSARSSTPCRRCRSGVSCWWPGSAAG